MISMLRYIKSRIIAIFIVVMLMLFTNSMMGNETESAGVRITSMDKQDDYLFVRGEVYGLEASRDSIVDAFVATNLLTTWNWIDVNRLCAGTNETAILIVPQVLEMTNMPAQLFVKMSERISENRDMADRDSDGSPNVYEIHNDTNPYIADFENAPKVVVPTDCEYATFTNALWSSEPYSIIEIAGEMYFEDSIDVPGWPLLITGPTNGYAVIHSNADIGIFMVNRRQTNHTLIRNIYLTMDKKTSFQAGFWIGGNLPWSTDAAGASFENVRLRMYNPDTWYYGWHMYGVTDTPVVISNCTISASGATDILPVYVYGDSQVVITNGLELVNMPDEPHSEEYTWTGYSLLKQYNPQNDSDNDGINDYDEIFVYETDPYLRDTDGDRIFDLTEVQHGASPTNQGAYCFNLMATITNDYANINSLKLAFYSPVSDFRISDVVETTNNISEVLLHGVVDNSQKPILRIWSANENTFVSLSYSIKGHENRIIVQPSQVRELFDNDGDDIPDMWELAHGLSIHDALDALVDVDNDGLINLHEYWASSDPVDFDATNTLLSVCAKSVDDRLIGKDSANSMFKFSNYIENGTNFVLNPEFWANDVDTSCVSMWNDAMKDIWGGDCSQWHKAGTAISKRHIITAWHYAIPLGTRVWFMGNDGVSYYRIVTGCRSIGGDICIQLLDSDLPDAVVPVKIIPRNYMNFIRSAKRLPVVTFDQEEKLIVADSSAFKDYSNRSEATGALRPTDSTRLAFYENVISGDSGNPRFLLVRNKLALVSVMHYGGTGSGCLISHYAEEIQQAMNILCDGYQLNELELDEYEELN